MLEIRATNDKNLMSAFAKTVKAKVESGRVVIPTKYGEGYVLGFAFGANLRIIVRNYSLTGDLKIKRVQADVEQNKIFISFKNLLKAATPKNQSQAKKGNTFPSVIISTQGLNSELYVPGKTSFNEINLAIDAEYLRQLLDLKIENGILKNIVDNAQPLLFESLIPVELEKIAADISHSSITPQLIRFFYKVKAEELICRLFMELTERSERKFQSLNGADVKMIFKVRDKILENYSEVPPATELAALAGMSESKLRRVFRQVFGDNIYGYHQSMRMKEAANLLRVEKKSVSETGYHLGFSNLSHFSRVFEAHMGMKPKRFSMLV